MKNNVFLKTLLFVSLACIVGSSNAQTSSEATSTISRTFYKNDGTPLEGVGVTVTKVVKNGRIISRGPATYLSNASGVVSIKVPQGSTVYMETPEFNTPGGVPVNITAPSGWTYTYDSLQPLGTMSAAGLIVQRNDITVVDTLDVLDFSTTFNVSESPANEANISINHDSLKARPGSKLTYLHNLFVDRGLSAWDETSLANAHTKALDSNFVLIVPPDYPASTMTFSASDASLKLINYDTLNITSNQTIPAGASIVMAGKGNFNISSGITLTFASGSRFDGGGRQRRFIGAGSVKFQEGSVDAVYPEWWGAVADSTTPSLTAIESAIASGVKRNVISFAPGVYKINDHIDLKSNIELVGNNTCIVSSDTNDHIFKADSIFKNIKISGFTLRYRPVPKVSQNNTSAFYLVEIDTLDIYNNKVLNSPGMGMQLISIKNARIAFNVIDGVRRDGIHVVHGDNINHGRTLFSENVVVMGNTVNNAGDDKIAVVSYQRPQAVGSPDYVAWTGGQQLPNRNITVTGNTVEGGSSAQDSRGIAILGGKGISVTGNNVRGHSGGRMIAGIKVDRAPGDDVIHLDGFPAVNVSVVGNTIIDGQMTSLATGYSGDYAAGIQLGACDSVVVANNVINFSKYTFGIRLRAINLDEAYYRTSARAVQIVNNRINNSRIGIAALSTSTQHNEDISVTGNVITNTQQGFINADNIKGFYITNNVFQNVKISAEDSVSAIRANNLARDFIVRGNTFRSTTNPDRYAIELSNPDTSVNFIESDNTFILSPTLGILSYPNIPYKFAVQGNARVHYATAAPTNGTWAVGDLTINSNPSRGSPSHWTCVTAGTPGTWAASVDHINVHNVNDTTGFVLNTAGAATITNASNVILDTFGSAALDTCTTLTGTTGQVVYISTRNGNRDIVFLDGTNFRLNSAQARLRNQEDVLMLKAITPTIWKQMGGLTQNFDNNRFTIDDTTGVVLSAAGTGTVSGIGNLVLDTFGSATLDTCTTLTGTIGQIVYISTRNGDRDIVFLDGTNFRLNSAKVRLRTQEDVLVLKATTSTIWKQMGWLTQNYDNNRFTIDDTTVVVLSAPGAGTVSGIGNLVLDTFGASTLDTVTTLTGNIGQVAYISSRSDNRDLVFQDGTNFKLSQGTIRLQTKDDVLLLKATTTTSWKQIAPFWGNTGNTQLSLGDTTGFVLSASGAATVSSFGNVVLDTFGGAATDTAVTLTGDIGQIVYIKTRSSIRDIRFRDLGNFALQADRLLDHVDDVLALIAVTTTTWKELFFANNN